MNKNSNRSDISTKQLEIINPQQVIASRIGKESSRLAVRDLVTFASENNLTLSLTPNGLQWSETK